MRYSTRFPGDKKQKTVYMNLKFPAEAVFPDADEVWDIGLVPNASELNIADLKGRIEFMDPLEQLILREEDPERLYRYVADGLGASSEIGEMKKKKVVSRLVDEMSLDPKALDCYQPRCCGGTIESSSPGRKSDWYVCDCGYETNRPKRRKYRVREIPLAQNIG